MSNTIISVSLFKLYNGYNTFSLYLKGLYTLMDIVKDRADIKIRLYYNDTVESRIISNLEENKQIDLIYYNWSDEYCLIGALLRYELLFKSLDNCDLVLVFDLDITSDKMNEYINYIPEMKTVDFTYSIRRWYRSGRYWYDKMTESSPLPSHMVRGWGMSFKPGLLSGLTLLDDYIHANGDKLLAKFKAYNNQSLEFGSYANKKKCTWKKYKKFQYGTVELFTCFYLLPTVLLGEFSVMQISVQYGTLECLLNDLLQDIPLSYKNRLFIDRFGVEFKTYMQIISNENSIHGDVDKLQEAWTKLLNFISDLIAQFKISVDRKLWNFIKSQSVILTPKTNKKILSESEKLSIIKQHTS